MLGPHDFRTERVQVSDTVSMAGGTHAAKAGIEALLDQNEIDPRALARAWYLRFRSLPSFASGTPAGAGESYTQTLATAGQSLSADVRTYSAFVQDTWRISRVATADLGVRYDVQTFTHDLPRDTDNWAPRVGLAIRRGDHAVIRSGYGMFYGVTPSLIPTLALLDGGLNVTTATVQGSAAPAYPNLLSAVPAARHSTTVVDTQFENAVIHQANIEYMGEISRRPCRSDLPVRARHASAQIDRGERPRHLRPDSRVQEHG